MVSLDNALKGFYWSGNTNNCDEKINKCDFQHPKPCCVESQRIKDHIYFLSVKKTVAKFFITVLTFLWCTKQCLNHKATRSCLKHWGLEYV